MRRLPVLLLFASVWGLIGLSPVLAQEKKPQPDRPKIKPATEEDLRHGMRLRIWIPEKGVVPAADEPNMRVYMEGTLVRTNDDGTVLYIRRKPRTVPVRVDLVNLVDEDGKKVRPIPERITPANYEPEPEIFTMTVEQGPVRSSRFESNVLSAPEMRILSELQAAENEVAKLEVVGLMRTQMLNTEELLRRERVQTQRLINLWIAQRVSATTPPTLPVVVTPFDFATLYAAGYGIQPAVGELSPTLPPESAIKAVAEARDRLRVVQTRAVYDNGQVIAVVYEPK